MIALLRSFPLRFVTFLLLAFPFAAPSYSTIQYEISLAHPELHTFHIKMIVPDVKGSLTVQMPAWNALYEIRDFSAHVQKLVATNGASALPVEKLDKQTWRITGAGTITISYDTFWDEPGPFATQLNAEHAFINPAMILMYLPDRRTEELQGSITDFLPEWNLVTPGLSAVTRSGSLTFWSILPATYDAFADSPLEIGKFDLIALSGPSSPISVAVHGRIDKHKEFETQLAKICNYELQLMGGAPFEHYLFVFHVGEGMGGGGMEHANATAIAAPNENSLLAVSAHEFFHLWNVKRIKPASLVPVDYSKEQYTKALWFAEGVTSTYERYALTRTGIWNKNAFYADLGRQISEIEARPANAWQSAEQSSLDTWLENSAVYNRPENSVSYYTKGAILGVLLDLWIRQQTNNTRSLDDMMRAMNDQFGKMGKPYRDHEDLELVCSQTAGTSCKVFFDNFVSGTKPFPYDEYFGFAGLKIRHVARSTPQSGPQTFFEISEDDAANEKQKQIRVGILKGETSKPAAKAAD
ncbi:MAG: M61 family metallopeptidase [Acidobacteria bacterium]|nr:M61 family metallopeptidase [Acidobacteriota bacterium]MBS1867837.1 M61 family metallopeptidase [Acidobacteriota bacterium]